MSRVIVDISGQRFGLLRVIGRAASRVTPNGTKKTMWECTCDCGNSCIIGYQNLKVGYTKSCGCFRAEMSAERLVTHKMTNTPTYRSYRAMLNRCKNPSYKNFKYWGGKGVKVCDRWLESFENFLEDMGERPKGTSINRVQGAMVYSKETCKWDDRSTQSFEQSKYRNNTSGVTGVSENRHGSFIARISVNNKQIHLGSFSSLEEATKARQDAEIKYYGINKQPPLETKIGEHLG